MSSCACMHLTITYIGLAMHTFKQVASSPPVGRTAAAAGKPASPFLSSWGRGCGGSCLMTVQWNSFASGFQPPQAKRCGQDAPPWLAQTSPGCGQPQGSATTHPHGVPVHYREDVPLNDVDSKLVTPIDG